MFCLYRGYWGITLIGAQVGNVGPKSIQTIVVGIITDEMHSYTFFVETLLLENWMYPYYSLVCVLFGPTIQFINLVGFCILVCVLIYTKISA